MQDPISILRDLIENEDKILEMNKSLKAEREEEVKQMTKELTMEQSIREKSETLLVENAVPCILHAEMRINEKLFYSFLEHAFDRYQEGPEHSKLRAKCKARLEECMNTVILGNEEKSQHAQWQVPYKEKSKEINHKTLSGDTSNKIVKGMKTLVTLAFGSDLDQPDKYIGVPTRRENQRYMDQWFRVLDAYIPMMTMAKRHEDFSDDDILEFHKLSATFMAEYCDLPEGKTTVTNYIHMFGR